MFTVLSIFTDCNSTERSDLAIGEETWQTPPPMVSTKWRFSISIFPATVVNWDSTVKTDFSVSGESRQKLH